MANVKNYQIKINGLTESISAVDSLNKHLDNLEQRINNLQGKTINISGGGRTSQKASELSEIEKIEKEIAKVQEKQAAHQSEEYKALLMEKEALKQIESQAKASAKAMAGATNPNEIDLNIMAGMKQRLRDLKLQHNNTNINSDVFKEQTREINELTQKLKDLEAEYGVYSRNVGNYANSMAEGFKKLPIEINGVVQEFDNAKQALAELKKELSTLQFKQDEGIISEEEAERMKSLIPVVSKLKSSIEDAGKPMDAILDTMQSFVGLAQASKGISALFGFDNGKIDETIKNLVALQNAMQGIQTIQKQLQTGEGLGKYFSKANKSIDDFTKKLFGLKTELKENADAQKRLETASNGATNAEKAQAVATTTLTTGMRVATVAARVLSTALKTIGIGFLLEGINLAIDGIKKLGSSIIDSFNTSKRAIESINNELNVMQRSYSYMIEENNRLYDQGTLTYMDYMTNQLKLQNEYIANQIRLSQELSEIESNRAFNGNWFNRNLGWATYGMKPGERFEEGTTFKLDDKIGIKFTYVVNNLTEAKEAFEKFNNAIKNGNDYWAEYGEGFEAFWDSFNLTASDTEKVLNRIGEGIAYDLVERIKDASIEYEAAMEDLKNGAEGAEDRLLLVQRVINSLSEEMQTDFVTSSVIANLDKYIPDEDVRRSVQNIIDIVEVLKNTMNADEARVKGFWEDMALRILPENEQALKRLEKQYQKDLEEFGRTEEQKARITEVYEKERNELLKRQKGSAKSVVDYEKTVYELRLKMMKDSLNKRLMQLDDEKRQTLNKLKGNLNAYLEAEKLFEQMRLDIIKQYTDDIERQLSNSKFSLNEFGLNVDKSKLEAEAEELALIIENGLKKIPPLESELSRPLQLSFGNRMDDMQEFHQKVIEEEQKNAREKYAKLREAALKELELQKETEDKRYSAETESIKNTLDLIESGLTAIEDTQSDAYKKLEKQQKDAKEQSEKIEKNHTAQMELIQMNYNNSMNKLYADEVNEQAAMDREYYGVRINDFRNYLTRINDLAQKQPEYDIFSIVSISKTKRNYKEISAAANETLKQIDLLKKKVAEEYKKTAPDLYNAIITQLNDVERSVKETNEKIKTDMSNLGELWWSSINNWLQELGQATSSILSSLSEITSNGYEKQIDEQQAFIDKYEELLQKQEDITKQHADRINDIEDELANSRGDRRQHLIDQLNAEIQAQRESLKEEEAARKKKEAAEHKQADLEYKQALARKDMDKAQAAINAAMAISMAAVNHWPIPAIPLMALATAVGAAQVAAVKSQYIPKPKYEKGGMLVGPSHKNGGIPVGNTGIEVEGNEYVVNKKTTLQNEPLLEFINSKKRRIDLSDMIEYFNDKPRATIKSIRSKFENGGVLTSPNVDISGSLDRNIIIRDETPIVVAVTDILSKASEVRRVQTLAGLAPSMSI